MQPIRILEMAAKCNHLVFVGDFFQVEFYYDENQEIPIWEAYQGLTENEKVNFMTRVKKIANTKPGVVHPKTILNLELPTDKVFALKFGQNRFCTFFAKGKKIIITNSYIKKSKKNTKVINEKLKKAKKYKADFENRVKNKTY